MSLTARILLALGAGIALGAGLAAAPTTAFSAVILGIAEPIGALWLDGLRMTIIPLVFAMLVTGVASAAGTAATGGIAARTLLLFALLLLASAMFSVAAMSALLALWPTPAEAAAALRTGAGIEAATGATIPPVADWLKTLVPTNIVKAAADGAMLSIVIFALIFGFAATRIEAGPRKRLVGFFEAVVDTMLVVVRWVLKLAPVGVFALALVVGARAGLGAAGALAHYVLLVSGVCIGVTLAAYPLVAFAARIPLPAFARAAAPAQAVAFSTQSSLASLPAMIEGVNRHLNVPERISSLVLPLAVSLFRITSPAANLAVAIYVAQLQGVELSALQLGVGILVAAVVSLASVGLPSQVSFFTAVAPVCLAMGVPIEPLAILLAVETIPDIFRTVGNVTGDVAATGLMASRHDASDEAAPSLAPIVDREG